MTAQNESHPIHISSNGEFTEAGQVDLLGNQMATRQCYQVIVEVGQIEPAGNEPKSSSAKSQCDTSHYLI